MLLDDEQDKQAARSQFIGFVLLMALLFIWLQYFMPKPPPPQPDGVEKVPEPVSQTRPDLETVGPTEPGAPGPSVNTAGAWPNLPPLPAESDPSNDEITLRDEDLELVFTRIGARLKRASVLIAQHGDEKIQLVPEDPEVPDWDAVYPLGVRFTDPAIKDELDRRRFEVERASETSVRFRLTLPNVAIIRKTFSLTDSPHVVNCTVEYENLEEQPRVLGMDRVPAFILNWGPNVVSGDVNKGIRQSLFWRTAGNTEFQPTAKFTSSQGDFEKTIPGAEWLAVRSAYFVVAFKPQVEGASGWSHGNPQRFRFGVAVPRCEIAPGGTQVASALLYVGPGQMQHLKSAWPSLDTTVRFFEYPEFLNWFAKTLLACLNWFYGIVPNYGVAIILLTVLVRLVMVPLTLKQMRSMKHMQLLAPEMEKLKEKYADDPQQFQAKMWELYRERGVNPLGGCLPLVLQLPVFIALYRMIWSAYELRSAPFVLWMKDLSEPDRLLHIPALKVVPFVGDHIQYLNVLPVVSAAVMVISMKLMPMSTPSPNMQQQQRIMMIMPVFFSLICYSFASGLQLYIITSTIWGIAQSKLMRVNVDQLPEKRQPRKREHFYTAAMRKRQRMAKEAKGNGKRRDGKKKSEAPQRQFPPTWWPF